MTQEYSGISNLEVMSEARNYNRFLEDLILAHAGSAHRILDFGAGTGIFARRIRARFPDLRCVEPDPGLLRMLQTDGFQACADLGAITDGSVDYAYSLNVLEHIEDDAASLRLLRSKLAPQGRVLFYVPAFAVLFGPMDRLVGHYRRYTRNTLASALTAASLTVEEISYADPLGFFAALVHKAIGNSSGRVSPAGLRLFDRWVFPGSLALQSVTKHWFGKNVWAVARAAA